MPIRKPRVRKTGIRKVGDGWEYRKQTRRGFRCKGDAYRYRSLVRSALAEAERKFRSDEKPCCSIRSKLDEFITDSLVGLDRLKNSAKTAADNRRRLLAFDKAFQSLPLDCIDRGRLERWMKNRIEQVGAGTVNKERGSLFAFLRWAQKKKYAPDFLPLLSVGRIFESGLIPGLNRKPPKTLEIGEVMQCVKKLRKHRQDIGLFLGCMALFGLRPAEVAALRRENYKPPRGDDPGRLYSRGVKRHPDRDIPIQKGGKGHEWLTACLALGRTYGRETPRSFLVPCKYGRSPRRPGGWTTESFDMALRRLCARKTVRLNFLPYWVRHGCISYAQTKVRSAGGVQQYAGHQLPTTQNVYTHRHAWDAMPVYEAMEEALKDM